MILFTSDLDRTLIYSKRMIENYPIDVEITPVEHEGNKVNSYMTSRSIELMQEFNEKNLFVPVTTRAVFQYERIDIFQKIIKPKYAITSNGGTIFIDGKKDETWSNLLNSRISDTSIPKEDMLKAFARIRQVEWVERGYHVDELFYMFLVKTDYIPHTELEAFGKELKELGWRIFLHGRKLYILPYQLNKAYAVSHLQNYVDYDFHVAAGDSMMDYDMLIQADMGFSPTHGEIFQQQGFDAKVKWLSAKGAASTDELISSLLKMKKIYSKTK